MSSTKFLTVDAIRTWNAQDRLLGRSDIRTEAIEILLAKLDASQPAQSRQGAEPVNREAHITVNGVTLTDAQSMTVRVALESFSMSLEEGLGEDKHGQAMVQLYRERLDEIRGALYPPPKEPTP